MLKKLLMKYKEAILYILFGGFTTLVNIVTYGVCYNMLSISNVVSNIFAWILAVLFAFITNKLWVFESKSFELHKLLYEFSTFVGCRLLTGILDLTIMYISVDCLHMNGLIMKLLSNILVIIGNYIASKLVIFRKKAA